MNLIIDDNFVKRVGSWQDTFKAFAGYLHSEEKQDQYKKSDLQESFYDFIKKYNNWMDHMDNRVKNCYKSTNCFTCRCQGVHQFCDRCDGFDNYQPA
jgi:hypothetical protein